MPAKREMSMRQIRLMLRLAGDGISSREIARTVNVARSTIQDYLRRAKAAGLTWPLPDELTDDVLQSRLFASVGTKAVFHQDMAHVAQLCGLPACLLEQARVRIGG